MSEGGARVDLKALRAHTALAVTSPITEVIALVASLKEVACDARFTGVAQALARAPGMLMSTVLTCMVGALLPPVAGLVLFVGGLALMAVLCSGGLERTSVRLVGQARALSQAESAALAPRSRCCAKKASARRASISTCATAIGDQRRSCRAAERGGICRSRALLPAGSVAN